MMAGIGQLRSWSVDAGDVASISASPSILTEIKRDHRHRIITTGSSPRLVR